MAHLFQTIFLLANLFRLSSAAPCTAELFEGEEYSLSGALTVLGFSASVSYRYIPEGMTPSLKILTASETPIVTVGDDGSLTIATGSCGDTGSPVAEMTSPPVMAPVMEVPDATSPPVAAPVEEAPVEVPTEAEEPTGEEAPTASGVGRLATGFLGLLFPSRASIFCSCLLLALGELQSVVADGHLSCTPTLTVEISMPVSATATETFGETDHYLAATVETVTWGYFDPNATTQMSMESGETVTVEVITHHSGHDYAKMIRGDPAVEEIFYFESNMTLTDKPEPKLPGSGVHLITGPIEVVGAMPGDVLQVDILELDPRPNPVTGKTFGTNSQKFAGYQYRGSGTKRDGTPYVRTGGTEAITVIEFIEDEAGNMLYGKPVYMYRFPNMTGPDGSMRTFDNNPAFMVPHEFDHGYNGELLDDAPIAYPPGFDDTVVTDEGGIVYLSPDMAMLNWKAPLRPHLGTLAVMPNNTANYIDESAPGGANTIPPARFGGNIDDWRIGKGGTMYYVVEVPGAQVVVGDTHAAQGDSELAGTAMETSMTTKLRMTLHKKEDGLPKIVETLDFPLLETKDKWIVHGFAFANYLDDLEDASTIFAEGASIDLAMQDCFVRTRNWLMDVFDLIEEETIAINFAITQVVDGNWGVHADIPKWVFDDSEAPFDYSCTTSGSPGRRRQLRAEDRRLQLEQIGVPSPEDYHERLFSTVSNGLNYDENHGLAAKLLDAKLAFVKAHV